MVIVFLQHMKMLSGTGKFKAYVFHKAYKYWFEYFAEDLNLDVNLAFSVQAINKYLTTHYMG